MPRRWILVFCLVLALAVPMSAFAGKDHDDDDDDDNPFKGRGNQKPHITDTHVNEDQTGIDIQGEWVHLGVEPAVILGSNGEDHTPIDFELEVTGMDMDGTRVTATLPENLEDGAYRLTVETERGDDEFVAVIGAAGPQGLKGDPGRNGEDGRAGEDGDDCTILGTVVTCGNTSANVQGPQGDSGTDGKDGADGLITAANASTIIYRPDSKLASIPAGQVGGAVALCDDTNDVILSGGCSTSIGVTVVKFFSTSFPNARDKYVCDASNQNNIATLIGAIAVCLRIPGP